MKISLSPSPAEYEQLYAGMVIDATKQHRIDAAIAMIEKGHSEYILAAMANKAIPWYAIGIAHYMECACDFTLHIHNGDTLKHRTLNEPIGRPIVAPHAGEGKPYTWQESCLDWLVLKKWVQWKDWGVSDILYRLEANNGFGYRRYGIATPYLWSFTNQYTKGKFTSDGKYDANAISNQVGAAILLKHFAEI